MNKLWVTTIVIVAVAGAIWWTQKGGVDPLSYITTTTSTPSYAPTVHKTSTPVPTPAMSYTELLQVYGTNRIQFDRNCQAQPTSTVFKNGARILLDNRSNQALTIGVNGTNYSLGAYGYQAITLASPTIPITIGLRCNNLINVGTIQLQANISGQ